MKQALVVLAVLVALGITLSILLSHSGKRNVSMLLVNGVVYTANDRQPVADAVAIDGNTIAAVGLTDDLLERYSADTIIDVRGRTVLPGLIDSHAHLEGIGAALMNLDVSGTSTAEGVGAIVEAAARTRSRTGWIRGRGWDQNRWPGKGFPDHGVLDRASPGLPVFLKRVDGHAAWVNQKVMRIAGISAQTPDPPGGRIIRDLGGNPTGVFVDNAVTMLEAVLPPPSEEERAEAIRRGVAECISFGLTEVHDMGVDLQGVQLYKDLIAAGQFPFRVYVALDGSSRETWQRFRTTGPTKEAYEGRLTVRALKLYADGALGSRGAALFEQYADDPGNRGLTLTSKAELLGAAVEALESGFQLCTHAIGDRANSIVLDVYEEAFKSHQMKGKDVRFRVEHAQVLAPSDIPRFSSLSVLPMMQPTHCTSDMPWAESRLGPIRINGAYAWRSLREHGSIVPAGSDSPVESPNPLWGFYAAVTRRDREGMPPEGWQPGQRMTRDEALKAFTIWGAFAGFQEREKGSLEPGKWADLVIVSKDIMKIQAQDILTAYVELTIIAGKVVYSRKPILPALQ